jgi:O-antigen/teichoic acid export membrane protein
MHSRFIVGVMAQGVASISNIVVTLFVARTLGAEELGRFSLVFAVLALATAIQSAWVGDALVVLGPAAESAARWWQHVLSAFSVVLSAGVLAWTGRFSLAELAAYLVLCAAWLYEEFGRQWFMAHLRFVAQGINDAMYLVAVTALLAVVHVVGGLSLLAVLWSIAGAAAVAVIAGQAAIPHDARVWRRPAPGRDLRAYSNYGTWRAVQAATGALGTVATRSLIVSGLGLRPLGNLELGRTILAPAVTVLTGIGNVLLPVASAKSRADERSSFRRLTVLVTAGAVLYGVVVVIWAPFFVRLLGGPGFQVSRTVLIGWAVAAATIALTQSVSIRALVDLPSRRVLVLRTAGTLTSLALVGLAAYAGWTAAVPFAIAAGTLLSGVLLHSALRQREKQPVRAL